jgi:hypothetical protein
LITPASSRSRLLTTESNQPVKRQIAGDLWRSAAAHAGMRLSRTSRGHRSRLRRSDLGSRPPGPLRQVLTVLNSSRPGRVQPASVVA